jgi:ABC-type multidrug transport system fused ATPase/permease subunit
VNITIPSGASVGLIGPSGTGKSTIADVILGILTPTKGAVMYGDMNVHEHPLAWSKKLAYIPQAIFLADESIRCNIAFGIDEDKIDDDKVWQALREAQLDGFVKKLPDGLDTMVGERGVRLSGGQRQRVGIARALYGDPEILVLDEATSALDSETEAAVMDAIDRLHGRKTLIIIAHRLTTISNCEIIFKVGDGHIVDHTKEFRKENG